MGNTSTVYPGETIAFSHNGVAYTATIEADPDMGAPWSENDGHGVVSDWTTRAKCPGEVIIATDYRGRHLFYDFRESVKIARRAGWGYLPHPLEYRVFAPDADGDTRRGGVAKCGDVEIVDWNDINTAIRAVYDHYRSLETPRQYAANAAMKDMQYCCNFASGHWEWVGIVVRRDGDCKCCGESASLWGIESLSDRSYFLETAIELAEEIEG